MEFKFIWQAILIVLISTFLLRLAGKKTISEMTLAQTVLIISFGTLIIQPVTSKSVTTSFIVGAVLVGTLLLLEYGQLKSVYLEKIITGKAKTVVENGFPDEEELAKLRLTVEQLEMNLREKSIHSINDLEWATLEPSGKIGFSLKKEARPASKKDIQQLEESIGNLSKNLERLERLLIQLNKTSTQNHFEDTSSK